MSPRAIYYAYGPKKIFEILIFTIFIFFFFGPLLNLVMMGFAYEYWYPMFIPEVWSLRWWRFVFARDDLVSAMFLSFSIALATTLLSLVICLPAAYAFARFKFPFKKMFIFSFLLANAFPRIGLFVTIGVLFFRMGIMGTLTGVMMIHMINTLMFMTWIPAGAFRAVRKQQEEAARDVGAGPFRAFLSVTLPLAMPGIFVACIFTFLGSLEEAQGTLIVGMPNYRTVPVQLYTVIQEFSTTAAPVVAIILVIPTIILMVIASKVVKGGIVAKGMMQK